MVQNKTIKNVHLPPLQSHYVALMALRHEFLAAIFEGYNGGDPGALYDVKVRVYPTECIY